MDRRVADLRLPALKQRLAARRLGLATLVIGLVLTVTGFSLAFPDRGRAGYLDSPDSGMTGGAPGQCVPLSLDIQGFPEGYIFEGDEFAAQGVQISVDARNGFPDNLIIFDSDSTDGDLDDDLRVGIGNILILANNLDDDDGDGLVDAPDENNFGGIVTFTFDQPVTIDSFIFVDHDHQPGDFAAAYDAAGNEITKVFIPIAGNGSVQTVEINANNVSRFVLNYRDSGAFVPPDIECPPGTPTPPGQTPTPPGQTPTPPGQTPTPPGQTPTPPGQTPTPPGQTPTPPVETGTATPPVETATPPVETGTATPPVETGTATPPVETATPPVETATPPVETATPPIETGTATPPVETATPPVETGTATPPVETATPPVETGTATPPGETATPTPTPTGSPSPTPTGPVLTATSSPAPTATVTAPGGASPTPSPQGVLGAVSGPTGPGAVPTTGGGVPAPEGPAAKLLIVLGLLLAVTGGIVATSPRLGRSRDGA
jgi:hypothetical protein